MGEAALVGGEKGGSGEDERAAAMRRDARVFVAVELIRADGLNGRPVRPVPRVFGRGDGDAGEVGDAFRPRFAGGEGDALIGSALRLGGMLAR